MRLGVGEGNAAARGPRRTELAKKSGEQKDNPGGRAHPARSNSVATTLLGMLHISENGESPVEEELGPASRRGIKPLGGRCHPALLFA